MHLRAFLCAVVIASSGAASCWAGDTGTINDPDGYTNVRSRPSLDAPVVGKVLKGERFTFEKEGNETFATWVKVQLPHGKTGFMHASRVRIVPSMDDLKDLSAEAEINVYAKAKGLDYYPLARAAARGNMEALRQYFSIGDTDGAAAEEHCSAVRAVLHLAGDDRLAAFLEKQSKSYREKMRGALFLDFTLWPFEPGAYLKRNFPKSAKYLLED